MRRKNRPESPPQTLAASTAERIGAIVEAAERAAVAVIDDAEAQARRHLEQAQAEADRTVAERIAELSGLTDSLVAQAESIREQSERLLSTLEEAKRRLAVDGEVEGAGQELSKGLSRGHLTAVAAAEPANEEPDDSDGTGGEVRTPAGARLLATQMAVSGSSREEIEARLRNGFEIEDTASILDAILGPED